jgi:hypothetical protein
MSTASQLLFLVVRSCISSFTLFFNCCTCNCCSPFYFRSLIIAAFADVSDAIDVSDNENDETEKAAIARATKKIQIQVLARV